MNLNDVLNSLHQHEDTADATTTPVMVLVNGQPLPHSIDSIRSEYHPDLGTTTLWVEVSEF
jgi:hypothetical protein